MCAEEGAAIHTEGEQKIYNSCLLPSLKQACTSNENSFYTQDPHCEKRTLDDANAPLLPLYNLIGFALKYSTCDCQVRQAIEQEWKYLCYLKVMIS